MSDFEKCQVGFHFSVSKNHFNVYLTTQFNSAFYPCEVGTGVKLGCLHMCQLTGKTVISYGRWCSVT